MLWAGLGWAGSCEEVTPIMRGEGNLTIIESYFLPSFLPPSPHTFLQVPPRSNQTILIQTKPNQTRPNQTRTRHHFTSMAKCVSKCAAVRFSKAQLKRPFGIKCCSLVTLCSFVFMFFSPCEVAEKLIHAFCIMLEVSFSSKICLMISQCLFQPIGNSLAKEKKTASMFVMCL